MTSRQLPSPGFRFTHASNVIPVVKCSDGASGITTRALEPLKISAPPRTPAVVHEALKTVPTLPFPDASETAVPVPSSNEYDATRPVRGTLLTLHVASSAFVVRS